jgi:hypothetical protein
MGFGVVLSHFYLGENSSFGVLHSSYVLWFLFLVCACVRRALDPSIVLTTFQIAPGADVYMLCSVIQDIMMRVTLHETCF